MTHKGMQGIACDGHALRLESGIKFLHAKESGGAAQQMTYQPGQCRHMVYPVSLHDVPKHRYIHVPPQQFKSVGDLKTLGFREAADYDIAKQGMFHSRPLRR